MVLNDFPFYYLLCFFHIIITRQVVLNEYYINIINSFLNSLGSSSMNMTCYRIGIKKRRSSEFSRKNRKHQSENIYVSFQSRQSTNTCGTILLVLNLIMKDNSNSPFFLIMLSLIHISEPTRL